VTRGGFSKKAKKREARIREGETTGRQRRSSGNAGTPYPLRKARGRKGESSGKKHQVAPLIISEADQQIERGILPRKGSTDPGISSVLVTL